MQIQNTLYSGIQSYGNAVSNLNKASLNIESIANEDSDVNLETEVVNLELAKIEAKAGSKVLDAYDETIGTLIDIEV